MKHLLYYLLIASGVVLLFSAFESAPNQVTAPTALVAAPAAGHPGSSAVRAGSSGSCTRTTDAPASHASGTTSSVVKAKYGPEACNDCHDDQVAAYKRTTHSKKWPTGQACEQCHGDVTKHVESQGAAGTITNPATLTPAKLSETCLKCHEKTGEQSHAKLSEHARAGVACVTCHDVHPTGEQKAKMNAAGKSAMMRNTQTELCLSCHTSVATDLAKPSHHKMKEGALNCTSCHNPHGSEKPHQLRADTKTLCFSCHQDKRGPFMYEHNAQTQDGCLACHEQHGSAGRNMIKVRDVRELCLSCHSAETLVGVPHGRGNLSTTSAGDCTRCHTALHGSNRDKYFIE